MNEATPKRAPSTYAAVGQPIPRVDLPAEVIGEPRTSRTCALPGMLHGRVVRPPTVGRDAAGRGRGVRAQDVPGLVRVVGTATSWASWRSARSRRSRPRASCRRPGRRARRCPPQGTLFDFLRTVPSEDRGCWSRGDADGALGRGGADPAGDLHCALPATRLHRAVVRRGRRATGADTVCSSTQALPCCKGRSRSLSASDRPRSTSSTARPRAATATTAPTTWRPTRCCSSQAVGRPVRVQWMRADEHVWEPKGPPVVADMRGGLDATATWWPGTSRCGRRTTARAPAGRRRTCWPGNWSTRRRRPPRTASSAATATRRPTTPSPTIGVTIHWLPTAAARLRRCAAWAATGNVFANESFLDELAAAAGADPVEFRLRYLDDPRARAVVQAAAERAGWQPRPSPRRRGRSGGTRGRGIAFLQYENQYCLRGDGGRGRGRPRPAARSACRASRSPTTAA